METLRGREWLVPLRKQKGRKVEKTNPKRTLQLAQAWEIRQRPYIGGEFPQGGGKRTISFGLEKKRSPEKASRGGSRGGRALLPGALHQKGEEEEREGGEIGLERGEKGQDPLGEEKHLRQKKG